MCISGLKGKLLIHEVFVFFLLFGKRHSVRVVVVWLLVNLLVCVCFGIVHCLRLFLDVFSHHVIASVAASPVCTFFDTSI